MRKSIWNGHVCLRSYSLETPYLRGWYWCLSKCVVQYADPSCVYDLNETFHLHATCTIILAINSKGIHPESLTKITLTFVWEVDSDKKPDQIRCKFQSNPFFNAMHEISFIDSYNDSMKCLSYMKKITKCFLLLHHKGWKWNPLVCDSMCTLWKKWNEREWQLHFG